MTATAAQLKRERAAEKERQIAEDLPRSISIREDADPGDGAPRTAILLISHGSHAPTWRRMLLDVHADAAPELLTMPGVAQVRTAFMEYTEPSIATQLRAFDEAGIERIIAVPLLLTISDHSYDDIPAICGQSDDRERIAELAEEGIEVYRPRAEIGFAPLLDFSDLVRTNLARRVRAILGRQSADPAARPRTGLALIGYGSAEFEDDWNRFFKEIRAFAETELGFDESAHAWCGHLVHYSRRPTMVAINGLLATCERVVVMPLFVAFDPMFQNGIIGGAVERSDNPGRVLYRRDAILPEPAVSRWVIDVARSMIKQAPLRVSSDALRTTERYAK